MVLYIVVLEVASAFGYDHSLLIYAQTPNIRYSDMNGYAHFLSIGLWYYLYWAFWALFLGTLTYLLWNRGALRPLGGRIRALTRVRGPSLALMTLSVAGVLLTGAWCFYNSNIRNDYTNTVRQELMAYEFEDRYLDERFHAPVPSITGVELTVDLFPEERRSEWVGTYQLENKNAEALGELVVDYDYGATLVSHRIDG
ncbi:MAG: hypothetical protein AAFY60_21230, partial [Myxococcota bacterium]